MSTLPELLRSVIVLENGPHGAVLAGSPATLSKLCLLVGFRNPCERGRIFLTAAKVRLLGLSDAVGVDPGWRSKSVEQLRAEGKAT